MRMKWEKLEKNLEIIFCRVEFQKLSHLIFLEKKTKKDWEVNGEEVDVRNIKCKLYLRQ